VVWISEFAIPSDAMRIDQFDWPNLELFGHVLYIDPSQRDRFGRGILIQTPKPFQAFVANLCRCLELKGVHDIRVILDRIGQSASCPVCPRSRPLARTSPFGSFVPIADMVAQL
jgi:hypothetical protein